jgi:TonB-dependent SusC/RagA subfamily outer membrane receptor
MKNLPKYFITVFCLIVIMLSCKSSQYSSKNNSDNPEIVDRGYDQALAKDTNQSGRSIKPNEDKPSNLSLADMLRQTAGVTVTGQGNNVSVRISGISSFGPSDPLYVVNGTDMGNSFSQVANFLNPNDITSITVLKGNDAAIYGSRGGNGVIVIRTK